MEIAQFSSVYCRTYKILPKTVVDSSGNDDLGPYHGDVGHQVILLIRAHLSSQATSTIASVPFSPSTLVSSMGYVATVPHAQDYPPGSAALDTGTAEMGLSTVEPDVFQALASVLELYPYSLHFPGFPYPSQYRSYNPVPS